MKVLVAAPHMCPEHRPEPSAYDELVVMMSCVECDKEQTMFMGLETGDLYSNAIVVERSDIEFDSLESMVHAGLRFLLHLDKEDPHIDAVHSTAITEWMASLAGQLDADTLIGREGKRTYSVVWGSSKDKVPFSPKR